MATASTLAYVLCADLWSRNVKENALRERLDWLCAMGTMGDLGTGFNWETPFPDMRDCLRRWTKKAFGEAIGLVNARKPVP